MLSLLTYEQEEVAEAAPWRLSARVTTDELHTALTDSADVASAGKRTMPDIAVVIYFTKIQKNKKMIFYYFYLKSFS